MLKHLKPKLVTLAFLLLFFYGCDSEKPNAETTVDKETPLNEYLKTDKKEINFIEEIGEFESHDELVKFFGSENVKKGFRWKAEGSVKFPVSILFYDSNHPLNIYWEEDQEKFENIRFVEIERILYNEDFSQFRLADVDYWNCKNGLKPGMTIEELETLLGSTFSFYGLEWDYGGLVISDSDILTNYGITLGYIPSEDGKIPPNYSEIIGDKEFKSDNKTARELPLTIVTISYVFNK